MDDEELEGYGYKAEEPNAAQAYRKVDVKGAFVAGQCQVHWCCNILHLNAHLHSMSAVAINPLEKKKNGSMRALWGRCSVSGDLTGRMI